MFQLTKEEFDNLLFQIGRSSWGGRCTPPIAFTEQGVAMLSGILNNDRAIKGNIQIMRLFTRMRVMLETNNEFPEKLDFLETRDIEHDENIMLIFEYLRQLEQARQHELNHQNRKRMGFKRNDE